MKHEWRKQEKELYLPKKITRLSIPNYSFITLTGAGNPNRPEFSTQIAALYTMSYHLRMAIKKGELGEPFEYTVYPLEGVWTTKSKPEGPINKEELLYKLMIRQPKQVTKQIFTEQLNIVQQKKENPYLQQLAFEAYEESEAVQMIHVGSYDTEVETFAKLYSFSEQEGVKPVPQMGDYQHREIYLTDPRRTAPEKAKTLLRLKVITE